MHGVTVTIVLGFITWVNANERASVHAAISQDPVGDLVNTLVDKIFDKVLQGSSFYHTRLENTRLERGLGYFADSKLQLGILPPRVIPSMKRTPLTSVLVHASRITGQSQDTLEALPPLEDRVFLVTGATDGIGEFTAKSLAKKGCTVLVHGRNPARVERVVNELKQYSQKVEGFVADLSRLDDVRRLGAEVSKKYPIIHGLANNAGTFDGDYTGKRVVTIDGNEYSLTVNVLAPFLLTSLLLQNVRASGAGRVLVTSSCSAGSNHKLSDLQCETGWSDHTAYELSKLCDAMIAMELHDRYADPPKLCFHTMDPGTVGTKMLLAGWFPGAPVETATRTFKMLTEDSYQETSGSGSSYCCGEDAASRQRLWAQLEELTGARWP